jgi:hypothetical protein
MAATGYYTVVRNVSGSTKYFDWMGRHGATLANGADANIPGDLWHLHADNKMKRTAMVYALEHGLAQIIKTPDVYGFDAGWGAVRRVKFNAGDITAQDPDTGSYSGSAPTLVDTV